MGYLFRSVVTGALLALAAPAAAVDGDYLPARDCLRSDAVPEYLGRAFSEGRVASATLDNGHDVEIYASPRGTWTMVELLPDGNGCIKAPGERLNLPGPTG